MGRLGRLRGGFGLFIFFDVFLLVFVGFSEFRKTPFVLHVWVFEYFDE